MSTKAIVGIVIILLAGASLVGYLFTRGSTDDATQATGTNESATTDTNNGKKIAFSEFIKRGGSYKCEVNQNIGDTTTKGTTYIKDSMIRGEYQTQTQGYNITTYMIVRDGYSYGWSSMAPTMGYKVKIVTDTTAQTGNTKVQSTGAASGQYSFNAEQIGDYNCEAWTADETMFTLPAGVTFREV